MPARFSTALAGKLRRFFAEVYSAQLCLSGKASEFDCAEAGLFYDCVNGKASEVIFADVYSAQLCLSGTASECDSAEAYLLFGVSAATAAATAATP